MNWKYARGLDRMGGYHLEQYRKTDQIGQLDEAIKYRQAAVKATPENYSYPSYRLHLNNLAICFGDRFKRLGQVADSDQAVKYAAKALQATPKGHTHRDRYLNNLASYLGDRFSRTNHLRDLNNAVRALREALAAAPPSHEEHCRYLDNLSNVLHQRFSTSGHKADLDEAIRYSGQAIQAMNENDPARAWYLSNHASGLHKRFERTGNVKYLNQAVTLTKQALEATSEGHPDQALYYSNVAVYSSIVYDHTDDLNDLDRAISYGEAACRIGSPGHPERMFYLSCLASCFRTRFQKSDLLADLDRAIQYGQDILVFLPDNHPKRTKYLSNLGVYFADRYDKLAEIKDHNHSMKVFRDACSCANSPPLERIIACMQAVTCLEESQQWDSAARILDIALELLPEVVPRTNSRSDLQYTIQQLSGLSVYLASVFLKAGRGAVKALQALESSRGFIASLTVDARSDISELREKHGDIWIQYSKCQEQISAIESNQESNSNTVLADKIEQRRRHYKELDRLRREIRKISGFERFLLPPNAEEIRNLARNGPIVCFNISSVSSEAFVVTPSAVEVVPLPNLSEDIVSDALEIIAVKGHRNRRDSSECSDDSDSDDSIEPNTRPSKLRRFFQVDDMFECLWNTAVKPIIEHLGLYGNLMTSDKIPHLHWTGGGAMALLPIHAAGLHSPESTENTLSYVVSSYASSLKTLLFAQQRPAAVIPNQEPEVLIVSMPTTPGHHKDLNTASEVEAIVSRTVSWAMPKHLERPGKEDVLKGLETCMIVHFACHGTADRFRPDESYLSLGKDVEEKLRIADLVKVTRSRAQIAYLSACSTAESKVQYLMDESIHLASTFQLIGFQHVLGSLWATDDEAAVKLATSFYERLPRYDRDNSLSVARALHEAVMSLRQERLNTTLGKTDIMNWAPFIHFGP